VRVDGRGRRAEHGRDPASSPKFFQASSQADFLKGDVENLSIDVTAGSCSVPPPS